MATIDIAPPEPRKITAGGESFSLLLSDVEILDAALALSARASEITASSPPEAVVAAARKIAETIDLILGPGAARKLAGGGPVSLDWAVGLLSKLVAAAGQAYSEDFSEQYDPA